MSLALDFATTVSSTVAAGGIIYLAREAREARSQISDNERRSIRNRAALYEEGLLSRMEAYEREVLRTLEDRQ